MYERMVERQREKILPAQLERRVYERLRDEIISGDLPAGEQLVEARIAEEFGVSKTPVREALIRLERDGLVEIEPYRGARVLVPSDGDIREVLELRLVIESQIARELAARRPPEVLEALEISIADSRRALESGDTSRLIQSLSEFSDILANACGNSRMAKILVDLRSVIELIGNSSLRAPGREDRSIAQHQAILDAIRSGRPDGAVRTTEEHIRSIEHDSLAAPDSA